MYACVYTYIDTHNSVTALIGGAFVVCDPLPPPRSAPAPFLPCGHNPPLLVQPGPGRGPTSCCTCLSLQGAEGLVFYIHWLGFRLL